MDEFRRISHSEVPVAVERTELLAETCDQRSIHDDFCPRAAHSGGNGELSKVGGLGAALSSLVTIAVALALAIGAWSLVFAAYLLSAQSLYGR
jgi:hypothetical protein